MNTHPITIPVPANGETSTLFTGLVEYVLTVAEVVPEGPARRITLVAPTLSPQIGDSIAINGCCLTVISIDGDRVAFQAGEETLNKTGLGRLRTGSQVNIERSLQVGDRLGGHWLTGHVDATISLLNRIDDPPWAFLQFQLPSHLARQVAAKGSVAIDGVSLTVVNVDDLSFSVALIPHTLEVTTLGKLKVGDSVNLETDVLAKYVQRAMDSTFLGESRD
jgi:riboflavin synthase